MLHAMGNTFTLDIYWTFVCALWHMHSDRWFWKDDTPAWNKRVWRFLLVASVILLPVLVWLLVR